VGCAVAPKPDLRVSLIDSIRAALNGPQREVFNALLELRRPAAFTRDELAERLGWDAGALALAPPALRDRNHGDRGASDALASDRALPNFLLTGSVDQVGRKSETTLRIASLHFEISTFSGTATDQLKLPSGAPDARHRQ
jgi:hypothetical protein